MARCEEEQRSGLGSPLRRRSTKQSAGAIDGYARARTRVAARVDELAGRAYLMRAINELVHEDQPLQRQLRRSEVPCAVQRRVRLLGAAPRGSLLPARRRIDPSSAPRRPLIHPKLTPERPQVDPDRPRIGRKSAPDRPLDPPLDPPLDRPLDPLSIGAGSASEHPRIEGSHGLRKPTARSGCGDPVCCVWRKAAMSA